MFINQLDNTALEKDYILIERLHLTLQLYPVAKKQKLEPFPFVKYSKGPVDCAISLVLSLSYPYPSVKQIPSYLTLI